MVLRLTALVLQETDHDRLRTHRHFTLPAEGQETGRLLCRGGQSDTN